MNAVMAVRNSNAQGRLVHYSERVTNTSDLFSFSAELALQIRTKIDALAAIAREAASITKEANELAADTRQHNPGVGNFLDPEYAIGNRLRASCGRIEGLLPSLLHQKNSHSDNASLVFSALFDRQCGETANALADMVVALKDLHLAIVEHDAKAMPCADNDPDGADFEDPTRVIVNLPDTFLM